MQQMTCPKCHGAMRQYERSGVTIDQCTECRGIFLDRGELEKLFDAESNWQKSQSGGAPRPQQTPPAPAAPAPGGYAPPPPPGHGQPAYPSHVPPPAPVTHGYPPAAPVYGHTGYHGHYRQQGHHGHYRRKSFLHGLFD
jgi:Zn-finger nucleic acid-binding protein